MPKVLSLQCLPSTLHSCMHVECGKKKNRLHNHMKWWPGKLWWISNFLHHRYVVNMLREKWATQTFQHELGVWCLMRLQHYRNVLILVIQDSTAFFPSSSPLSGLIYTFFSYCHMWNSSLIVSLSLAITNAYSSITALFMVGWNFFFLT